MKKITDRFIWASELANIKPTDNILEIGCGAGLLAEVIASKLTSGKFAAIDKSAPMVEKAVKRNKSYIDAGVSDFIISSFSNALLPSYSFDSIIAFNVNFFWKNPSTELEIIRQLLKPKGKLFVLYQAPYEIKVNDAEPIKQKLLENTFEIIDIKFKKFLPTSAFCIIAKPLTMK